MDKNFDFVTQLPGLVIAKDNCSNYISISNEFAKLLGWKSAHECSGRTDYEIPCAAAQFAQQFIKMDQDTIHSGVKMLALDIQPYSAGWKLLLVERNPIKNHDGIVEGLFNQCIDVSEIGLFKNYLQVYQHDLKLLGKQANPTSYVLTHVHSSLSLTEKQENCLFLLIRGKTTKEIAKQLGVSPRTIESHLDAMKIKLNCDNKSALIEKAIDHGFLFYIPKLFQTNNTST